MYNKTKRLLAYILSGILAFSSFSIPVNASNDNSMSSEQSLNDDSILSTESVSDSIIQDESFNNIEDIVTKEDILGRKYLSKTMEDNIVISIQSKEDLEENYSLESLKIRDSASIQKDIEENEKRIEKNETDKIIEIKDRFSLEDIKSYLVDALKLPEDKLIHIINAFDIYLEDENKIDIDVNQEIKVIIQIPKENDTFAKIKNTSLYHLKKDNTWENLDFDVNEEKREISFITTSFSPFVFLNIEDKPYITDIKESISTESTTEPTTQTTEPTTETTESTTEITESTTEITESTTEPTTQTTEPTTETDESKEITSNEKEITNEKSEITSNETEIINKKSEIDSENEKKSESLILPEDKDELKDIKMKEVEPSENEKYLSDKELTEETKNIKIKQKALRNRDGEKSITEDGVTIEKITIKWLSCSTGSSTPAEFDRLEIVPTDDKIPVQQWQIDFALSGKYEHEAGTVEIVIPASIWTTRDGDEAGILTLSVPEDPEVGVDFSWKRIDDKIVFTNTRSISAATKLMLQGSYRQMYAHEMIDMDLSEDSEYQDAECKGISDELYAVINIVVPNGNVISMTSNSIDASINTKIEAASASKTAYNSQTKDYYLYWDVPTDMIPEEFIPENAEDYVYVRWFVTGQAEGTQPYIMTITDNAIDEYGCRILGIEDANGVNVKSTDQNTVTAELYSGYNTELKSAYVWTAYDKSFFSEDMRVYTIQNTQTITVTGQDDLIATSKEASAEVSVAKPIDYTVIKEWDDEEDKLGVRPNAQEIRIYRNKDGESTRDLWKTISVEEDEDWTYTWSDEGKAWHYELEEINMAHGSLGAWYDLNGQYHNTHWHYYQKERSYNPDTKTYLFQNAIAFEGETRDISDIDKQVWWEFDDHYQRSTRDRALNDLLKGKDIIVPYDVWGISENYTAWHDCIDENDIHAHRVNVVLEDSQHTDSESDVLSPIIINTQRITAGEDYELAYANIDIPSIYGYVRAVQDASLPEDDPNHYYNDRYSLSKYDETDIDATFEGYINDEWVVLGELHNGELTGKNGGSFSGHKLRFPEGVVRFREVVNSFGAVTELSYTIGVKIHPSQFVLKQIQDASKISDYMMMTIDNFARIYDCDEGKNKENVTDENPLGEPEDWELSDWDRGFLHGRKYRVAAYEDKHFELTNNDTTKRLLTLHTKATTVQQSNILAKTEYNRAIQDNDIPYTTSGVWYDLLPMGVEPILSTIQLQSGDKIQDAYTIDNYKGSGRTMLVVLATFGEHISYTEKDGINPFYYDADYPKEGYKQEQVIEFDSYYSWEDAQIYGLNTVRNTIAFKTDDEWIGNLNGWSGETDDPRSGGNKLTEESVMDDLDIMTGLTSQVDDTPSFVYAGAPLIYDSPDFMAETSIRKWVAAEGMGIWAHGHNNEAIVTEGGKYKYRIDLSGDNDFRTKDIIVLDSLENYVPSSDKEDYGDNQWKGHLLSIDVTELKRIGIEPVIYYSLIDNLNLASAEDGYNGNEDIDSIPNVLENAVTESGEKVWSTTPPDNLSDVKAFAIDCRKKTDGTDFYLPAGDKVSFYIYMKAPCGEETENIWCTGEGQKANPNPELRNELNPDDNAHAYNNVFLDSTQVDEENRETHSYIHWDYVKTGIIPYNLNVEKEWDDMNNNDGIRPLSIKIHLMKNGTDTGKFVELSEENEWKGTFSHLEKYDEYDQRISYTFEEDTCQGYEMSYSKNENDIYVFNTHEPEKINVPFEKKWFSDTSNVRPSNVTVKLYADNVYTGIKTIVRADEDGNWKGVFSNLYKYKDGREILYTIKEEPVDDYIVSYSEEDGKKIIKNTYHPYGNLNIQKQVENVTENAADTEFTFTLVLKDKDGNPLTDKYNYITNNGKTGKIKSGDTFLLKGGEIITIQDIPTHSTYSISESIVNGFTNTIKSGESGEILSYKESDALYVNTYASKGNLNLNALKILNGKTLNRYQFKFQVHQLLADGTDLGMIRMATNNEDGAVTFGKIQYTEADNNKEKIYQISEIDETKNGYTNDDTTIYVKVTPIDNGNGTMTCTPQYFDSEWNPLDTVQIVRMADGYCYHIDFWNTLSEEQKEELKNEHKDGQNSNIIIEDSIPATFINHYHANGAVVLRAWKQLIGRELEENEFDFELLNETGQILQTTKNIQDGSIVFSGIEFTEKDIGKTYYFFVREKKGTDDTIVYDNTIHGYEITVLDNGDGTLQFKQIYQTVETTETEGNISYHVSGQTNDMPVFTNRLQDGSLAVSKFIDGENPDEEQEFHFKVKLINPDGTPFTSDNFNYDIEKIENNE